MSILVGAIIVCSSLFLVIFDIARLADFISTDIFSRIAV